MAISLAEVEPLVALIAGGSETDAASSMRAVATMELDDGAWLAVDDAVRGRVEAGGDLAVEAAAHVPLAGLRARLREISADRTDPRHRAARRGLLEVGDQPALVAHVEDLLREGGWEHVMALSADRLAEFPNATWESAAGTDDGVDLFHVVAAGKAGRLGPLRRLLAAADAGAMPDMLNGNPMYLASQLAPALPIPASFERALRSAWDNESPDESNDRRAVLNILAEGLLGESVY